MQALSCYCLKSIVAVLDDDGLLLSIVGCCFVAVDDECLLSLMK